MAHCARRRRGTSPKQIEKQRQAEQQVAPRPSQDCWDKPGLAGWYAAATVVMFLALVVMLAWRASV